MRLERHTARFYVTSRNWPGMICARTGCQQNFTTGEDGQPFFAGNCHSAAGTRIDFLLSDINRFQQPAP